MALDFSIEPFFDDYSEDKKFHRILFRPGYAVQARELTQLQTILQEQIRRHGDHIFKEGSMVIPGEIAYDLYANYVKLTFAAGTTPTVVLSALINKEIKNSLGLIAKVVTYTTETDIDPNTIFVKYLNSVQDNAGNNVSQFYPGDVLTPVDGSGLSITVADQVGLSAPVGKGCSVTIKRGIYYIKKNFVLVSEQTLILDKYTNTPSYRIGLQLQENIIYPEDDESLLDNALGTPNYSAPGSVRYYIDLILSKKTLNTTQDAEFIELLRIDNGKVLFKIDRTQYAELDKTFARRTYDESGDYALSPFTMSALEYRNNLRGDWAAGEKYIQGDLIRVSDGSTGFWYFVAVTNGISGSTRPSGENSFSPTRDSIIDNSITWEYALFPNFNRGVNTFTSGTAAYSNFTLNDHLRLNSMLAIGVEAGKAYVRGYEIEKVASEYVGIQKSRYLPAGSDALCTYFNLASGSLPSIIDSISVEKLTSIDVSSGSYIICSDVKYLPDVTTFTKIDLHSVVYASIVSAASIIGTARVRAIERHDTVANSYKVFLFDIKMNVGKVFANVRSLYTTPSAFSANPIQESSLTVLNNPDGASLIYDIPDYAIVPRAIATQVGITSVNEVDYSVVASFTRTSNTSEIWSIDAPSGYTFESVSNALTNYIVTDLSNGSIITPALTSTGTLLTVSGLTSGVTYSILATLKRSNAVNAQINLTVTDATAMQLTTQTAAQATTIALSYPLVTRVVSILMDTRGFNATTAANPVYSLNITNRYSFNSGQYSTHADLASITKLSGSDAPIGPIRISYEYLAKGAASPGGFLNVDSYTWGTASKMTYDQIFSVSDYALRDAIDFRPIAEGANFAAKFMPKYGTTASIKYRNYLERIDSISLSVSGNYVVSRGIPSNSAIDVKNPDNTMKLSRIRIEPYTFSNTSNSGVAINRIENKRYTMRDIGTLERRIQDLEYYTSLTLSEIDTKNMRIVDTDGFDRYQNGFLVDSFDGQGVGNAASDDWNASIDSSKKELRPFFSQKQVTLLENVDALVKSYKVSGDLVTLPYTEQVMIEQSKASKSQNLNPFAAYTWKGIVDINPWSDTWFSTSYRPDIILNDDSQYNALVSKANADGVLGTVWNSWQVVFSSTQALSSRLEALNAWSAVDTAILSSANNGGSFWRDRSTFTAEELDFIGNTNRDVSSSQAAAVAGSRVLTIETSAVETQSTRAGTRTFITDKVDSRVVDDRVVDTHVVPYIRPRAILFTGYGFKPSTRIYSFFDGILVDDYIVNATRIEIVPVSGYTYKFDTLRNAGSAVSNVERTVNYSDGAKLSGTVTLTNGSTIVVGLATAFLQEAVIGDILNTGTAIKYTITAIVNNYSITISPAYAGSTVTDTNVNVIGPKHTTQEVEVAFNHGEVIKEYVNGTWTGNSAIVLSQETSSGKYYLYVMNIKGNGQFSTSANAYFEGEYLLNGSKPRVKFIARTDYASLTSSDTGLLCGVFKIPSNPQIKFRTGTRELRFSDDVSSTQSIRNVRESTGGGAFYEANGLVEIKQRTIVSTRTASLVSTQVSDNNTIVTTSDKLTRDTGWFDPLAQTFMIQQEGGAFITSADLYFATADTRVPTRIEIREVVNGYPGNKVLPFSRVEKKAADIVTSSNATVATTFTFTSPVFLQDGVEYALVALSDSNNYAIHIAEMDTIGYDDVRISSQPYNGVLFKSQNASTWTADQTQDMKFTIRRAVFSQTPVTIEFVPPKLGYANLGFNPFNFITDSKKCRVIHRNHGMITGEIVKFKTRQVIDSINGISASNIFNVNLSILSAELDSYVVEFLGSQASTATGAAGGGYITATENYEFQTAMIEIAEIVPPGTSITYKTNVINHSDVVSSYSMSPKQNLDFEEVKVYPSETNYASEVFTSGLNVIATLTPASSLDSVSPVIDLSRLAMTMVSNKIDNPTLDVNDTALDYYTVATATEIGVSKPIQLVDIATAGQFNTLLINSVAQPTLYERMNNNLNPGDVLRFVYTGITDATRSMTIVSKSIDTSGNLYFTLEAFNGIDVVSVTTNNTVSIWWLSHYKSEYAVSGGSVHSKYVTKKINFSRPSDMLKIMFSAVIPTEADVEIYYKTGSSASGDFILSRYYKALPNSNYLKSNSEFTDITADVENLQLFDSVIIKLVMKSTNKARVPRIKNFRVISCAAV